MPRKRTIGENIPQTQKARQKNAPRKLPRRRPRALTSPLPPKPPKSTLSAFLDIFIKPTSQQISVQSQSPLLARLPLEIRQIIWAEVLAGHVLHIARARGRLVAIGCSVDSGQLKTRSRGHFCWGITSVDGKMSGAVGDRCLGSTPGYYCDSYRGHPAKPVNLLSLLRTCRMVYTDAIPILYGGNVFDINHVDTFLYLKRSVLPQRLNQIRRVNLTWEFKYYTGFGKVPYNLETWREVCEVLAGFGALQEVTVHLSGDVFFAGRLMWKPLLDPLERVNAKRRFYVFLPWGEKHCVTVAKELEYRFRLVGGY